MTLKFNGEQSRNTLAFLPVANDDDIYCCDWCVQWLLIKSYLFRWTYTCWKRRILSRMLNCCQRLEKLTFPSIRSGFPRWTKVRSWRMRPLWRRVEGINEPVVARRPSRWVMHIYSQVRDARGLHFSQCSSVCPEGGGAVDQRAILLQSLREKIWGCLLN